MGENKANLTKARIELEELYLGIPDESVNLTFRHFAEVRQIANNMTPERKIPITLESITELNINNKKQGSPSLKKIPSIDFNRALQASSPHYNSHHQNRTHHINEEVVHRHNLGHHVENNHAYLTMAHDQNHHQVSQSFDHLGNMDYNHYDVHVSMASMYEDHQRPGLAHSKICTICSTYVYIFRHRCLVCGRVYCRDCVNIGMGEMREGRKCIECLGRRFSQRYIQRAGGVGCCFSSYPNTIRQVELKWAEKGPRRSGEKAYNRSRIMSTSRSPIPQRSPPMDHSNIHPNSFVMNSSYSPCTPTHLNLPF